MKKIPGISIGKRKLWLLISMGIIVVLIVAGIAVAVAIDSGDYNMPWTAGDNSGGGERTSGIPYDYKLTDVVGQTAPGSASSTNYHLTAGFLSIMPIGTTVKVYVALQGSNRPSPEGWAVPLTVCFCPENSDDNTLLNPGTDVPCFTGTATAEWINEGTKATVTVGPVNPGTYDITADSSTTLLNVKRSVYIE